ncbi:MAG: NfeD family protein [Planctomycetota bacterium]
MDRPLQLTPWVVALLSGLSLCTAVPAEEPAQRKFRLAALIEFTGDINPLREAYFNRKLDKAMQDDVDLVIVEIDSPGGYVDSSLRLAETLANLQVHTVAYVPRQALSGAAIMSLGCDEIVMGPTARIGDAGPIFLGEDALFRHAPEKIRSDLVRQVRDLAERSGRPPALAEAMVDMDLVVYRVQNTETGETDFMSDPELESLEDPNLWEKGRPIQESREGLFLEVNGRTAVDLKLANGLADSREQLRKRYGLGEDDVIVMETDWVDGLVMILNMPIVTGLLFVVGLIALYIEFSAPGIGLGGLIAGLCFSLFFWSRFLGGTSDWLEVILFLAGLVFLIVEIYVIPGFGVAGFTGMLMLVASVVMASQDFVIPHSGLEMRSLTTNIIVTGVSAIVFLIAAVSLTKHLGMIPLLSQLTLAQVEPMAKEVSEEAPRLNGVGIGDVGHADSALRPAGRVMFDHRPVDVVTDGSFVEAGRQVRVIEISGNRIVVREIADSAPPASG